MNLHYKHKVVIGQTQNQRIGCKHAFCWRVMVELWWNYLFVEYMKSSSSSEEFSARSVSNRLSVAHLAYLLIQFFVDFAVFEMVFLLISC